MITPPTSGPSSVPTICPVVIQPSAKPSSDSGTIDPTSAVAALVKPPATPISARDVVSSHTLGEKAIIAAVSPPKMLERTTIALRPTRSATSPHSGANSAPVSALMEKMMPDQRSTAAGSCTPSCSTWNGMKGSAKKNEPTLSTWMPTMIKSVVRHFITGAHSRRPRRATPAGRWGFRGRGRAAPSCACSRSA